MANKKITRYRGDTYSVEAVLSKGGVPLDMTAGNNTAKFSYGKRNKTRNTIDGINGSAAGEISFPFPINAAVGLYLYDIQVTSSSGEVRTYIRDELEIVGDVTP